MSAFYQALVFVHVAVGFAGLVAFWVPIASRKGGNLHRAAGRVYVYCAYVVLVSAGLSSAYQLSRFLGPDRSLATHTNTFASFVFLGYLALVTFIIVHHGHSVLKFKSAPQRMRTPVRLALAGAAIASSLVLIGVALWLNPSNRIVLYALSPIGITAGWGILRYLNASDGPARGWFYEHLGSMIGGGIAFHTAFFVFGANRLFELGLSGWLAVIPWIAPTVIGVPASALWTRHYRLKFGDA